MTTRFYDGDSINNRYCWDDEYYLRSETNNDPGWRGDFKGLADKLDYIKALGFSAVWITPVVENASGLDYHGYHAYDAFGAALQEDEYFNDSTWNVTYVDSHEYAPENQRFAEDESTWAENLCLMFTFRGIHCIYYGSEIQFQKGRDIDPMTNSNVDEGSGVPYNKSGRVYLGDNIEGTVNASDTDDSYVLVNVSGSATFNNVLNGEYVELVTGKTVNVTNGSLTTDSVTKENMRVYVLQNDTARRDGATGKVGEEGADLK